MSKYGAKIPVLLLVVGVILFLTISCTLSLPEYALEFRVTHAVLNGSDTMVTCLLDNVGEGDLENIAIEISCITGDGIGSYYWIYGTDLGAGESISLSVRFVGISNPEKKNFSITTVGWDAEED